jgi:hypothetical protein
VTRRVSTQHPGPHPDPRPVALLVERAAARPPGDLPQVAAEVARACWGADDVVVALATHEQTQLVSMTGTGSGRRAEPVDDGPAGRCFTTGEPVTDGATTWVPVTHHGDRLGVLGVCGADTGAALTAYADAVAVHLAAARGLSDEVEIARRTQEMALGAELMHAVQPPLAYADDRFALAALVEPSYSSGGDVLDHAVEGDVLHAMLADATGHGWPAALVSAVAVTAYRGARRAGEDLLGTWAALERWVGSTGGGEEADDDARYVTAVLVRLDLGTGRLRWLSAGHPPPVVVRADGAREALEGDPAPPLGTGLGGGPTVAEEYLEPGDVLALHTDGVTEARALDGHQLGLEGYVDLLATELAGGGALAERVRRVRRALLARDDAWLGDDATALLVEWHGGVDGADD